MLKFDCIGVQKRSTEDALSRRSQLLSSGRYVCWRQTWCKQVKSTDASAAAGEAFEDLATLWMSCVSEAIVVVSSRSDNKC
jgi:hypothetical protein